VFAGLGINLFEPFLMTFVLGVIGLIFLPVGYFALANEQLNSYVRLILVALPLVFWTAACIAIPLVMALVNIHLVSRLAHKRQKLFARCLAFTSLIWTLPTLVVYLLLSFLVQSQMIYMVAIFSASWMLGSIAQFLWAYDRCLLPFMRKAQPAQVLAEPASLNSMIEQIRVATTSGELEILSAQCLTLMKIAPPALDFSRPQPASAILVEELSKGQRVEEASLISKRVVDLASL